MISKLTEFIPEYDYTFPGPFLSDKYSQNDVVFFDIETTGLCAAASYLYLVGCLYFMNNKLLLRQWFSQSIEEEVLILKEFENFVRHYKAILHFNGTAFDLPYLSQKCEQYNIEDNISNLDSIDLYRLLKPYKGIFASKDTCNNSDYTKPSVCFSPDSHCFNKKKSISMKQKSLEEFLHINRRDMFDGGELIDVYLNYITIFHYEKLRSCNNEKEYRTDKLSGLPRLQIKSSDDLLDILLLHNFEDVTNMLYIMSLLSLDSLFRGAFSISSINLRTETDDIPYVELVLSNTFTVPKQSAPLNAFCYPFDELPPLFLHIDTDKTVLLLPVYAGELKLFYPDYKNYFYLPTEDRAIHKSVAAFVDKDHKEKARQTNCYSRHCGSFLPQPAGIFAPSFKTACKSKYSYFDVGQLEHVDKQLIHKYITDILLLFIH